MIMDCSIAELLYMCVSILVLRMRRKEPEKDRSFSVLSDADIDAYLAPMPFLPAHPPMLARGIFYIIDPIYYG